MDALTGIGVRRDASPGQVALAWLPRQHPWVVPIPGTTKRHRLSENNAAVDVDLTTEDLAELATGSERVDIQGARHPEQMQCWIDR